MSYRLSTLHHRYHCRQQAFLALQGKRYAKVKRYMEREEGQGVCYSGEGLTYVYHTRNVGLRHIGNVIAESYGALGRTFDGKDEPCGWFTDPDGYTSKDGDGLCWGVVYQLPGRNHSCRFVAGYQIGGYDDGPMLDLTRIFECKCADDGMERATDTDGALEAARYADALARDVAEEERIYREENREEEDPDARTG